MLQQRLDFHDRNEVTDRVRVLKISLLKQNNLDVVDYHQHSDTHLPRSHQSYWKSLHIAVHKESFSLKKLRKKRLAQNILWSLHALHDKARNVLYHLYDSYFGTPLWKNIRKVIMKRVHTYLD